VKEVEEAQAVLAELAKKVDEITAVIDKKEREFEEKSRETQELKKYLDSCFSERVELDEILEQCSVDVCQYKLAFEEIKRKHSDQAHTAVTDRNFHFFLCFRGEHYADPGKKVIEAHQEVIHRHGYCWWGKFSKKRVTGGDYEDLEPFGESIRIDGESSVARKLREKVKERIRGGQNVYLYNYNPNPPDIALFVCNVLDFYFAPENIPYAEEPIIPPECARIPRYYFHKRDGNCTSCKKIDPTKCRPGFLCNFWFKIDHIMEIANVEQEFINLENCFTNDSINFAIPILYPLLVTQKEERHYFPDRVEPIHCPEPFAFEMKSGEEGHLKTEKVEKFFNDLNRNCGQVFKRVESTSYQRLPDKYSIQKSSKSDEVFVTLPSQFRRDGSPSRYAVYLHEDTTPAQKQKVEILIEEFLG
jgi:hypothetical protein